MRRERPLPPRPTPIVGREKEIEAISALLLRPDVRLLTLTGPPGVGKTRLALEIVSVTRSLEAIAFVDLAPIHDPRQVLPKIAQTLGIPLKDEGPGDKPFPLVTRVAESLQGRGTLLVLDNFEQVVAAATDIADLLSQVASLKVLVTSRSSLRLRWEQEFAVSPLPVPSKAQVHDLESLMRIPSVILYAERARAVKRDFTLTAGNAAAVAEICVRLDGLPLAIELAAGLVKTFPAGALLDQLNRRFDVLASSAQDLPDRHRSLHKAINSSYEALSPEEQALMSTVSAFSGGCTPEAAQVVEGRSTGQGTPALLARLVDKSLVWVGSHNDAVRFNMLESVREFCLTHPGLREGIEPRRRRHAAYCMALAEEARPHVSGPAQLIWLDRLEAENENFRSAVRWAFANGEHEIGLRIAIPLVKFWTVRGLLGQGRAWLEEGLRAPDIPPALRAQALVGLGEVIWRSLGPSRFELFEEARALAEASGDRRTLALALRGLAIAAAERDDLEPAGRLFAQSLALFREAEEHAETARTLFQLGNWVSIPAGALDQARAQFAESLRFSRAGGDRISATAGLYGLAAAASHERDHTRAIAYFEQRLALCKDLRYTDEIAITLHALGYHAFWQGHLERAHTYFAESRTHAQSIGSVGLAADAIAGIALVLETERKYGDAAAHYLEVLEIRRRLGFDRDVARTFKSVAFLVAKLGQPEQAAELLGAGESVVPKPPHHPESRTIHEHRIGEITRAVGPARFETARTAGRRMSLDQAYEIARAILTTGAAGASLAGSHGSHAVLSRREQEVAALIAEGLPNRAIAQRLFIGERTTDTHVQHILNKLGYNSRAQIAAWVARQDAENRPR